jgi:hypothetical protein
MSKVREAKDCQRAALTLSLILRTSEYENICERARIFPEEWRIFGVVDFNESQT